MSKALKWFLVMAVALTATNFNLGSARAEDGSIVLPPDPALQPPPDTLSQDPELDSLKWKFGLGGGVTAIGEVVAGGPKVSVALWGKISQEFGIEGQLSFGWAAMDLDATDESDRAEDTLIINGVVQFGYRTWGDRFQFLAGVGYDDLRNFANQIAVSSFILTGAVRFQFMDHEGLGLELRYLGGPGFDETGQIMVRQEAYGLLYWAF